MQHYLESLRRRARLVGAAVITAMLATLGLSTVMLVASPRYVATAIVTMLPSDPELSYTRNWLGRSLIGPVTVSTTTGTTYIDADVAARCGIQLNDDFAFARFKVGLTANSAAQILSVYLDDVEIKTWDDGSPAPDCSHRSRGLPPAILPPSRPCSDRARPCAGIRRGCMLGRHRVR